MLDSTVHSEDGLNTTACGSAIIFSQARSEAPALIDRQEVEIVVLSEHPGYVNLPLAPIESEGVGRDGFYLNIPRCSSRTLVLRDAPNVISSRDICECDVRHFPSESWPGHVSSRMSSPLFRPHVLVRSAPESQSQEP